MDDYIVEKISQLKNEYGTSDPFELLEALGVKVKYNYDFTKLKAFYYVMFGCPYVVLNGNIDEYQIRTVAAHELGHHVLHQSLAQNSPIKELGFYDMKSGPEYEANLFAANLLIDDEELLQMINEESDFYSLCSNMNVSPDLMAFKMKTFIKKGMNLNIPVSFKSDFLAR
jgi:Zn-dependent peptidase ImmA (M78 family)